MNIAILGYGKMGKEIEEISVKRGHNISLKVTSANAGDFYKEELENTDVAIDFSKPSTVVQNIKHCFIKNIPCVVGTTGWYDSIDAIIKLCIDTNQSFLYASNFSPGVNIFFELNSVLSKLMDGHDDYNLYVEEIHHTRKIDTPSGTALTLINDIKYNIKRINKLKDVTSEPPYNKELNDSISVNSIREGDVTGTHEIRYTSEIDRITLKHEAFSRKGFAFGAVLAAEWLKDKKGVYTMKDVLNIQH